VAGKWLASRLRGKGKIITINGPVDSLWDRELHTAWRAALRDPGYHIIFENPVDPPKVNAAKLVKEAIGRFQNVDAVFVYSDAAAHDVYGILKRAGYEKKTMLLGIGGQSSEGGVYVTQGILTATFLHPTGGKEAVNAAMKILHGESPQKKIVPPTCILTQDGNNVPNHSPSR